MKPSPMIALIAALTLATPNIAMAQSLTETRMQLQAALQRNLGRSLINGALRHVDLRSGEVTDYYPVENHEMILRMDEVYVMCATLVTADGREATVDYYMVDAGGRFAVIRAEVDNRAPLRALMDAGAHSDTSGHLFRRHMISHSGVSDHPEMTPSGVVW